MGGLVSEQHIQHPLALLIDGQFIDRFQQLCSLTVAFFLFKLISNLAIE